MSSKAAHAPAAAAAASEQVLRRSLRTASSDRPSYRSLLHPRDDDGSTGGDGVALGRGGREVKRPRLAHARDDEHAAHDRGHPDADSNEDDMEAAPGSNYCDEQADALAQLAEAAVAAEEEEHALMVQVGG